MGWGALKTRVLFLFGCIVSNISAEEYIQKHVYRAYTSLVSQNRDIFPLSYPGSCDERRARGAFTYLCCLGRRSAARGNWRYSLCRWCSCYWRRYQVRNDQSTVLIMASLLLLRERCSFKFRVSTPQLKKKET